MVISFGLEDPGSRVLSSESVDGDVGELFGDFTVFSLASEFAGEGEERGEGGLVTLAMVLFSQVRRS